MQLSLLVLLLGIFACHFASAAFKEEDGVIVLDDRCSFFHFPLISSIMCA